MSVGNPPPLAALAERYPGVFTRSRREQTAGALGKAAFALFTLYALSETGFLDIAMIWNGLFKLGSVLAFMLPPAHNGWFMEFLQGIFETLAMAFLGTLLAALLAVPLGFLGAKNVVPGWLFHFGLRRAFDGLRGIDQLIGDTGTLAKLFAEAIENTERRQAEGVKAAGASRFQIVRYAMLPQVLPVFLSQALYYFESNTRSATILGVVGAGGIGLHLSDRIRVNNWDEACFIILMILVTVALIDRLSRALRERVIGRPG